MGFKIKKNRIRKTDEEEYKSGHIEPKDVEQIIISKFNQEIDELVIKDTLKNCLKRTLNTILMANNDDRIFLLEVRKQLKKSYQDNDKKEFKDFLKIIDKLYQLAVDKFLFCDFNNIPSITSQNRRQGYDYEIVSNETSETPGVDAIENNHLTQQAQIQQISTNSTNSQQSLQTIQSRIAFQRLIRLRNQQH